MFSYEDVGRAADWIAEAFGFTETGRWTDDEGRVTHVNMELEGGMIMLGYPSAEYQSPKRHAEVCEQTRKWRETPFAVDGVHVSVDDIDAHYARARAAGGTNPFPPRKKNGDGGRAKPSRGLPRGRP